MQAELGDAQCCVVPSDVPLCAELDDTHHCVELSDTPIKADLDQFILCNDNSNNPFCVDSNDIQHHADSSDVPLSTEAGEVQHCAELSDGLVGVEQGHVQPSVELSDAHEDVEMAELSEKQIAAADKFAEDNAKIFMVIDIDALNDKQIKQSSSSKKSKPSPIETSFKHSDIIFTLNVCDSKTTATSTTNVKNSIILKNQSANYTPFSFGLTTLASTTPANSTKKSCVKDNDSPNAKKFNSDHFELRRRILLLMLIHLAAERFFL